MLKGIKVVEIGQAYSAPYCAEILGFLGADVIKIERPTGDECRYWGEPAHEEASFEFHIPSGSLKTVPPHAAQVI